MADKDKDVVKSLDKISDRLEVIDKTIREICSEPKEPEKNEEREFQLRAAKIQIYTDRCHAFLSVRISFVLVIFGFIVIFYPFYIQATLAGNPYSITGLVGLVGTLALFAVAGVYLYNYIRKYNRDLKRISAMIEAVRKGDDLPPFIKNGLLEIEDRNRVQKRKHIKTNRI